MSFNISPYSKENPQPKYSQNTQKYLNDIMNHSPYTIKKQQSNQKETQQKQLIQEVPTPKYDLPNFLQEISYRKQNQHLKTPSNHKEITPYQKLQQDYKLQQYNNNNKEQSPISNNSFLNPFASPINNKHSNNNVNYQKTAQTDQKSFLKNSELIPDSKSYSHIKQNIENHSNLGHIVKTPQSKKHDFHKKNNLSQGKYNQLQNNNNNSNNNINDQSPYYFNKQKYHEPNQNTQNKTNKSYTHHYQQQQQQQQQQNLNLDMQNNLIKAQKMININQNQLKTPNREKNFQNFDKIQSNLYQDYFNQNNNATPNNNKQESYTPFQEICTNNNQNQNQNNNPQNIYQIKSDKKPSYYQQNFQKQYLTFQKAASQSKSPLKKYIKENYENLFVNPSQENQQQSPQVPNFGQNQQQNQQYQQQQQQQQQFQQFSTPKKGNQLQNNLYFQQQQLQQQSPFNQLKQQSSQQRQPLTQRDFTPESKQDTSRFQNNLNDQKSTDKHPNCTDTTATSSNQQQNQISSRQHQQQQQFNHQHQPSSEFSKLQLQFQQIIKNNKQQQQLNEDKSQQYSARNYQCLTSRQTSNVSHNNINPNNNNNRNNNDGSFSSRSPYFRTPKQKASNVNMTQIHCHQKINRQNSNNMTNLSNFHINNISTPEIRNTNTTTNTDFKKIQQIQKQVENLSPYSKPKPYMFSDSKALTKNPLKPQKNPNSFENLNLNLNKNILENLEKDNNNNQKTEEKAQNRIRSTSQITQGSNNIKEKLGQIVPASSRKHNVNINNQIQQNIPENPQNPSQKQDQKPQEKSQKDPNYNPKYELVNDNNIESYEFGKILGLGSYGVVKLATHKKTGIQVAIKSYEKVKLQDYQKRKNVEREIRILSKLRHKNIVKLYNVIEGKTQLHLIEQFSPCKPLNQLLKSSCEKRIPEGLAKVVFKQVVDAIQYIHRKGVVHRDIKLENILIENSPSTQIRLIDFGFSIAIAPNAKINIFCGTPSYMAPEIVNKKEYSFPVDIWALGILLFKLITGLFPFRGKDDKTLYSRINHCNIDFPSHVSQDARNLIQKILKHSASDRLTAAEILKDKWLEENPDQQYIQQQKEKEVVFPNNVNIKQQPQYNKDYKKSDLQQYLQ